jgi:AraC family transcriptional regulator
MLLRSEVEIFGDSGGHSDSLLLTQSTEMLIRHLVCWHSNLSRDEIRYSRREAAPTPLAPYYLARILDYIEANFAREISLADLAQLVGVSKYHFLRRFREATKLTPYAYLVERRLIRAVNALKHTTLSVEQIARDSGFKSTPGFSVSTR